MNISMLTPHPTISAARQQNLVNLCYRVLVVDDEVSIREFIAEALCYCDYKVDTADNAISAFEKLQTENFDALITDYHMPKRTGGELVRQMRSGYEHSDRPDDRADPGIADQASGSAGECPARKTFHDSGTAGRFGKCPPTGNAIPRD